MNVPSWLSSAGIAALVSGAFLLAGTWVNGWRQRVFDTKQKEADRRHLEAIRAADRDHEEKLRQLQLDHERQLERDKDGRDLRDRKYKRLRTGLQVVSNVALEVVRQAPRSRLRSQPIGVELDQIFEGQRARLDAARPDLVLDAESEQLLREADDRLHDLLVFGRQCDHRLDWCQASDLETRRKGGDLANRLEQQDEPDLQQRAWALILSARTMLAKFEEPIG